MKPGAESDTGSSDAFGGGGGRAPDAVARSLYARDASAAALGIVLVGASADGATVRMEVRPEMCNGFGIAHGGMTFLLADSAMAFASNSATDSSGDAALATSAAIDWLAPVPCGAVLTATARRRWASGRSAVWDIEVTATGVGSGDGDPGEGTVVAVFRGRTRRAGGALLDETAGSTEGAGEAGDAGDASGPAGQANSEPR